MKTLKVQNIGRREFEQGWYKLDPRNTLLISINDPCQEPPSAIYKNMFEGYLVCHFLDIEEKQEFSVTEENAFNIVAIVQLAINHNLNILVHCNAGICRSGAVAELCEALGFEYVGNYKQPNLLVKKKLFEEAISRGLL